MKPSTHTRRCSIHFSRGGVVIHSARYRETAFFSPTATRTIFPKNGNIYQRKDPHSREAFASIKYWHKFPNALDALVESLTLCNAVSDAEFDAIRANHPDWTFHFVNSCGNYLCTAYCGLTLQTRISATSWQELNDKLDQAS